VLVVVVMVMVLSFFVVTIIPPVEEGKRTIHALSIDGTQKSSPVVVIKW
jgi:hypothetical protein